MGSMGAFRLWRVQMMAQGASERAHATSLSVSQKVFQHQQPTVTNGAQQTARLWIGKSNEQAQQTRSLVGVSPLHGQRPRADGCEQTAHETRSQDAALCFLEHYAMGASAGALTQKQCPSC